MEKLPFDPNGCYCIAGTTPTRLATRVATKMDPQHPHSHSLSMLGAERYQNQLNSTANAELFK